MLENVKAVLFDMDGTLVDSMWMWKNIDIEYLGRIGQPLPPELQSIIEGMSFTETAVYFKERFHLEDTLEEIMAEWNDMALEKYRNEVSYKPGAEKFLQFLRDNHIKTGICTSNSRELCDACFEALHMDRYIDEVVTACEVNAGKPSPDIYYEMARRLETDPENCIVFEDIPNGIRAGLNAGMRVCAVEDAAAEDRRSEIRSLATYYIKDYNEVLDGTYEIL